MEESNSFEKLGILEGKINSILELFKIERENNIKLRQEKEDLIVRLNVVENALMKESQTLNELNQEKFLTIDAVDELIKNIDSLVEVRQER